MPLARWFALLLLVTACVAAPPVPDEPPVQGARPAEMFGGIVCGRGVLTHADGSRPRPFAVRSEGRRAGDGLVLHQTIVFEDGETRERRWVLWPNGPARYRGTLTEASGPVRARVGGKTLTLAYALDGLPLGRMRQRLTLRPDGRVDNQGTASIAGLPVRRLTEVIAPSPEGGACPARGRT